LRRFFSDTLRTSAAASVATTFAVAASGAIENGNPVAPLNAVSHIIWGDEALGRDELSWKYTATGVALNAAASASWAALDTIFFGRAAANSGVAKRLAGGIVVSAIAYMTDFYIMPSRLTPGFEKRLSNRCLPAIYTALALSLTCGSLLQPDEYKRTRGR
jgi:hypothetical protein